MVKSWLYVSASRKVLPGRPRLVLAGGLRYHGQSHGGVLEAAVLRALPPVDAGAVGLDPHDVLAPRNEVGLSVQARDPEAVDDVGGGEPQLHPAPDGNVQLVGGDECPPRDAVPIAHLPPPLLPHHVHHQIRPAGVGVQRSEGAHGPERQRYQYQGGNHSPEQQNGPGSSAVALRAGRLDRPAAVEQRERQGRAEYQEHDRSQQRHGAEQLVDPRRGRAGCGPVTHRPVAPRSRCRASGRRPQASRPRRRSCGGRRRASRSDGPG